MGQALTLCPILILSKLAVSFQGLYETKIFLGILSEDFTKKSRVLYLCLLPKKIKLII